MKKKISTEYSFIIIFAVILAFLGIWYFQFKDKDAVPAPQMTQETTVTFACSTGTFTLTYGADAETAEIVLGAERYSLDRVETASGTRYFDANSTISFSENRGEARVALDDTVIYEDCSAQ